MLCEIELRRKFYSAQKPPGKPVQEPALSYIFYFLLSAIPDKADRLDGVKMNEWLLAMHPCMHTKRIEWAQTRNSNKTQRASRRDGATSAFVRRRMSYIMYYRLLLIAKPKHM